jgi:outer membrane immunogenic protein
MGMKNGFLCGTAASAITLALAGPGAAADLPVKAPPLAPPAIYNWGGFYVGGHVGWGRTRFSGTWFGDSNTVGIPSERPSGILGGVQAGYNVPLNNTFLVGFEGDVSFLNWKSDTFLNTVSDDGDTLSAKLNLLASLRGRLGITFDRALLYATGGVGYAHGKVTAFDAGGPTTFEDGFSKWGGVVGGGFEYAFTNNLIGRVEGLYYFFKHTTNFVGPSDSAVAEIKDAGVIRVGLSYKFGPFGP